MLGALERGKNAVRTLGAWPAILGWDEWEALAMVHQEKLCSDTRGDAPVVTADSLPDPADVTHRYKPGGHEARHPHSRLRKRPSRRPPSLEIQRSQRKPDYIPP